MLRGICIFRKLHESRAPDSVAHGSLRFQSDSGRVSHNRHFSGARCDADPWRPFGGPIGGPEGSDICPCGGLHRELRDCLRFGLLAVAVLEIICRTGNGNLFRCRRTIHLGVISGPPIASRAGILWRIDSARFGLCNFCSPRFCRGVWLAKRLSDHGGRRHGSLGFVDDRSAGSHRAKPSAWQLSGHDRRSSPVEAGTRADGVLRARHRHQLLDYNFPAPRVAARSREGRPIGLG